jgi:hypothetical protein
MNVEFVNCEEYEKMKISGCGVFGVTSKLILTHSQKVYVRTSVETDGFAKVTLGVREGDSNTLNMNDKAVKSKGKISLVHTCKDTDIGLYLLVDSFGEQRKVIINELVFETISESGILKKVLDKVPFETTLAENMYKGEPTRITAKPNMREQFIVDCKTLEIGKEYYIKVMHEEVTNCGEIALDCGIGQERGMIKRFKYTGKNPMITIKSHHFDYIVDIKAIVIVKSNEMTFEQFRTKEFWK